MLHDDRQAIRRPAAGYTDPAPTGVSDVTCRALRVALCAVQVHVAWHSGAISASTAMTTLEQEISEVLPSHTGLR
jgi:hypothetical protein